MSVRQLERAALLVLAGMFAAWAGYFIYSASLVTVTGERYFALFDDAMISMRYAWHLAHGHGLVWNPGEHVEGYTNLLLVLVMAVPNALVDLRWAVLSVHLVGVATMLGAAFFAAQIAGLLDPGAGAGGRALRRVIAFAGTLACYPLAYWTVMGMETGLLALLLLAALTLWLRNDSRHAGITPPSVSPFPQRWGRGAGGSQVLPASWGKDSGWGGDLRVMALLLGLAYLTRPESVLISGLLLGTVWVRLVGLRPGERRAGWRQVIELGALCAALPLAQHIFRLWYYDGELFANTYRLKAEGLPLDERIEYGWAFSLPFLREHALLLALAAGGALWRRGLARLLLALIVLVMVVYQIYIGGDVPEWTYWRIVAPVMPLAVILAADGLIAAAQHRPRRIVYAAAAVIGVVAYGAAAARFWAEQTFQVPAFNTDANDHKLNVALLLSEVTTDQASLGVFWAGIIPYYNPDHYAIDYLGKADPYIAGLTPQPGDPMRHWPGHNKRDLAYSIQQLQPTYSQGFALGLSDVRPWARRHYTAWAYDAETILFIKMGDPAFSPDAAFAHGLYPWVEYNAGVLLPDWRAALDEAGPVLVPANSYGLALPEGYVTPDSLDPAALARWQQSWQPDDLRAAGADYLLIDHVWWGALSEAGRAALADPALYPVVQEWRAGYVFLRLVQAGPGQER